MEPSAKDRQAWEDWLSTRPDRVREVAKNLPPWRLYSMKETGQIVALHSFDENDAGRVTVSVDVQLTASGLPGFNGVFGVDPDDLVPYDGP